ATVIVGLQTASKSSSPSNQNQIRACDARLKEPPPPQTGPSRADADRRNGVALNNESLYVIERLYDDIDDIESMICSSVPSFYELKCFGN
ncbi:hypothetical protein SFRURICE_010279, partial [Spodoptera frugiperda]